MVLNLATPPCPPVLFLLLCCAQVGQEYELPTGHIVRPFPTVHPIPSQVCMYAYTHASQQHSGACLPGAVSDDACVWTKYPCVVVKHTAIALCCDSTAKLWLLLLCKLNLQQPC